MGRFVHQRHQPPDLLRAGSELVLACPQLRSNVNFSRLVRLAGCAGVRRIVVAGTMRPDRKIARDAIDHVAIERHRSLPPVLRRLAADGYPLFGLEQTSGSQRLYDFAYPERCVLVIGHERHGIVPAILDVLDATVEIPVYGLPFSYNVVTAATMAVYEYGRQHGSSSAKVSD